ncbi:MAG: SAM-dependent methyltransferase [Psychromonas sp.]|jgi:SAM-dependent methyltransferase|uniref:class I SAM-dependent methyltransferase n=1 Tax=Psychromonas sp. TaxID=1884585 RepID=UPI0039E6C6F0
MAIIYREVIVIDIKSISTGLELGHDGIWYSAETKNLSYPSDGNEACFAVEDNSFWFRHRNDCIASVVKSYPPENNGTIFDIGGGNGFVSLGLANAGFNVALLEPGKVGASNAKKRGISNVICATTETAKFTPNSLSAVGLFDVIEHIEDDLNFLKSVKELMKKNACLYVTVPSYSFLWSLEDVTAGHFRRYKLNSILSVLQLAGFKIEFASYIFKYLPIPIFLLRTIPFKLGLAKKDKMNNVTSRDHAVEGGVLSNLIDLSLHSEIDTLNIGKSMSFGGSCLIVAKNS